MTRALKLSLLFALAAFASVAHAGAWTHHSDGTVCAPYCDGGAPAAPTITAGDVLVLWTFVFTNHYDRTLSTPNGWTLVYDVLPGNNNWRGKVFCRVATGSDTMPTLDWGTGNSTGYTFNQVVSFSGPTAPDCSTMLDASSASETWGGAWPSQALSVPTDNDLIFEFGSKGQNETPVDFNPIGCPTEVNDGRTANYTWYSAYGMNAAACYRIETTATSIGAGAFLPADELTYNSFSAIVGLRQQDISLPSWNSEPVVTKVDTNTLRATFNASTDPPNTVRCGAWLKGATKPSAADVAAGTGAHGTASATATGSSQYIDIDVTDTPPHPAYRVFCVQDDGESGYSDVPDASDVCLDPPSGFQFVGCPSGLTAITTTGSVPQLYNDAPWTNVPYDGKTANFTLDKILVDRTSGAWGFIRADSGSTLIVDLRDGTFADNDVIEDNGGGAALVNGSTSALTPRVAVGDILVEPVGMSPAADGQGCPGSMHPSCLTFDSEGSFSYTAPGRQRAMNGLVYHAATGAYLPIDADLVVNNRAPTGNPSLGPQVMTVGSIYALDMNSVFDDVDGDALQFAWLSGSFSPFTLNQATGVWSGTPGAENESGVDLQFIGADSWGDAYVQGFKAVPVITWTLATDCVGQSVSQCQADIRDETFNSVDVVQAAVSCSMSALATVLSQTPPAGTEVEPGSTVNVTVSAGNARACAAAIRDQGE